MNVNQKAHKDDENHDSDFSSFINDIFQLKPHQTKIDDGQRIKKEQLVEKGNIGDPPEKKIDLRAQKIGQKKRWSQEKQHGIGQPQEGVSKEAHERQDSEIAGHMMDPFCRNVIHREIILSNLDGNCSKNK